MPTSVWVAILVLIPAMFYFGITNDWGVLGYGFWSIVIMSVIVGIFKAIEEDKTLVQVNQDYINALNELKENPNSTDLRQKALHAGRVKASVVREYVGQNKNSSITVFDEISIKNDLDAIIANSSPFSYADELEKLNKLKVDGVITEQELIDIKSKVSINSSGVNDAIRLLRGLKDLEVEGALTESEYNMKKWEILSKRLLK